MTPPPGARERELSRRDEITVSLWLLAVLVAEFLLVCWFFVRIYAT